MNFQNGDTVQLKSGGPKMSVQGITTEWGHKVHCKWFVGTDLKDGSFSPESLVKVEDEKPAK